MTPEGLPCGVDEFATAPWTFGKGIENQASHLELGRVGRPGFEPRAYSSRSSGGTEGSRLFPANGHLYAVDPAPGTVR